jgi:hypothetical protein
MNSKLWVILVVLALGSLLLPAMVLAQEIGDESPVVSVLVLPPSPVLPDIVGPTVVVSGVVDVQITGPEVEFTREGTPTILPPNPVVPPNPIDE